MTGQQDSPSYRSLQIRSRLLDIVLQSTDANFVIKDVLAALLEYLGTDIAGAVITMWPHKPIVHIVSGIPETLDKHLTNVIQHKAASWAVNYTKVEDSSLLSEEEQAAGIRTRITLPLVAPRFEQQEAPVADVVQIGLLYLAARRPEAFKHFSEEELSSLAKYVAVALSHVLYVHYAHDRLRRLQALRAIDLAIIESDGITSIIDVVMRQVQKQLGKEAVAVHLWNDEAQRPFLFAMRLPNGSLLHEEAFELSSELLHELVENQEPVIIHELNKDTRVRVHQNIIQRYHLASYLGVPMTVGGKLIGILHILTTAPRRFSDEDVDFFVTLAGQAAIGISHVRAYEELAERAAAVDAFVRLSEVLITNDLTNPTDLVGPIMQVLVDTLHVDFIEFYVYEEEVDALYLSHAVGLTENETMLAHYKISGEQEETPLARVVRSKEPLYVADMQEYLHKNDIMTEFRSFYAVPVIAQDVLFGVLAFYHAHPYAFSPARRRLIELFVHETAVLLRNATLLSTLRHTNAELQQALQAREDMIRNVTHELRTPLTMIRGYAELISMGIVTEPEETREVSETILRNAIHLEHLIDQLLHFQTVQRMDMKQERIDVALWLREVIADWRRVLEQQGFTVDVQLQEPLGEVLAHPGFLREAIDNILDNARKFSPEKGVIRIRAWQKESQVYISISDQGIGIPKDQLEHVFERFYQGDASMTREYGGMGIGLALAKEIITQHGGRIWAESEGPGKGTTVTFVLPLAKDEK